MSIDSRNSQPPETRKSSLFSLGHLFRREAEKQCTQIALHHIQQNAAAEQALLLEQCIKERIDFFRTISDAP